MNTFEEYAADYLIEQSETIVRAWAERVNLVLQAPRRRGLPLPPVLDLFPGLLRSTAEFIRSGDPRSLTSQGDVLELLFELGRVGRADSSDPDAIMRDLDVLVEVLQETCVDWVRSCEPRPSSESVALIVGRITRVPLLMGCAAIEAYWKAEVEEVQKINAKIRDFTDTLAHELNTTLSAAEAAALLLEDEEVVSDRKERRRFANLVQRNLNRSRTVLSDARKLAFAHGFSPQDERRAPIGEILSGVLFDMSDMLRAAGIRLEILEPIAAFRGDASLIGIILTNLIGNAIKYSDPSRSVRWIKVRVTRAANGVPGHWLAVADNGLGIPSEEHTRIFQRFYRVHPDRAEGTGLGLTIVREAVRQLGGRLELESEPGEGSTFRVFVPDAVGANADVA